MLVTLTISISSFTDAFATATSGSVTGGSAQAAGGTYMKVSPPIPGPSGVCAANSVGDDCQQTPDLWAFDEDQNIVLAAPLTVDDSDGDGVSDGAILPIGTTVASHYVYFDPGPTQDIQGCVNFDSNVVATIFTTNRLASSDFLANTGVNYLNPGARGFEAGDVAVFMGNQVCVDFTASTPGDYFRVLTEFSPAAAGVGGEIIPIESTSLILAGAQTSAVWILPLVVAGVGLVAYRLRK